MSYTIASALSWAKNFLQDNAFDAEVLLAHQIKVTRSYLLAFPERELTSDESSVFEKLIERRKLGEPVAYLTGHKEFWSLDLMVTPDVLIPRPETELLVELVLQHVQGEKKLIADLGTGSGAIALALAHEHPDWEIHATDASAAALDVAQRNAERLQCQQIIFHQGKWCAVLPQKKFNVIVSNPPYIARDDQHLEESTRRYEPGIALFANEDGLQDMLQIADQARGFLLPKGYLMLEHGFQQADAVHQILQKLDYTDIRLYRDLAGLDRVTIGRY